MKQKKIALLLLLAAPLVLASCNPVGGESSSAPASEGSSAQASSEPEPLAPATQAIEGATYSASGAADFSVFDEATDTNAISGVRSFVGESAAKRTKILGALEKYAVDNAITGLPLFENGGKVLYNPRLVQPAPSYISGYGWGTLREGNFTGPLEGDTGATANYYHSYETDDPGTLLFLNADGSVVSDLNSYVAGGYFGTKMGADKKSYEWYGYLASEDRPWLVVEDVDAQGVATRTAYNVEGEGTITIGEGATAETLDKANATSSIWRVYLRTGDEGGVAYRTASTDTARAAFDGVNVELEDYVNAFRILLCGKYAYYRGNELAGQTGASAIVGASKYYQATANLQWDSDAAKKAFEGVGVTSGTDDNGDYIDLELGVATNRFYAMYNISSSLYSPINGDFFNLVTNNGADPLFYQSFNTDKTMSPVDNTLSVGPYYLDKWESGKNFQFKANEHWYELDEDDTIYNFPGVNFDVLEAQKTDEEFAFKQFLAGKLDSAAIPAKQIDTYKDDPRAKEVTGDAVFKLNVNSCDQDQWNALFGPEGSVSPHTAAAAQRVVKPWMSNDNFIKGMFYSIDRDTLAANANSIASINYFSSNYMSDPEGGVSYDATDEHAAAIADFWGETVATAGFSITESQSKFDAAIDELLAANKIKDGDKLEIEVWWQTQANIDRYGKTIKAFVEKAFNEAPKAASHNITLDFQNNACEVWSDVYYKHLMTGDFDLGFGSISGNSLDPLNFMEVLKSDNSSGFTLNWGPDTSALDLSFDTLGDGNVETYSFDLLWGAADHGVMAYNGHVLPGLTLSAPTITFDDDYNMTCVFEYNDVATAIAERAAAGDASALAVAAELMDPSGDTGIMPMYFIISDDATLEYTYVASYGAALYNYLYDLGLEEGDLLDDGGAEDLGIGIPTLTCNEGTLTIVIPSDVTAIALDEAGYLDIYYYGTLLVAGNESTCYQVSELYLG